MSTGRHMISDEELLDPMRLSYVTGWSFETWTQALEAARSAGIPDWWVSKLVQQGVSPYVITGAAKILVKP